MNNLPSYPFPTPCPLMTASHANKSLSLMGPSLSMPFRSSAGSECQLSSSLMRRRAAPRAADDVADIFFFFNLFFFSFFARDDGDGGDDGDDGWWLVVGTAAGAGKQDVLGLSMAVVVVFSVLPTPVSQ